VPRRPMPLTPRALAFAITLAVAPGMALAQGSADTCPLGAFTCPVVKNDFALCRKNDLLNFYEPGLPTEGNREASPAQVYGDHFSSPDSNLFHLSGNTALQRLDQLLRADSLTYNADTTAYDAEGHIRYQERGMLFSADSMKGTTTPEYGVADHVQYQLLTSRGNGVASQAIMLDRDRDKLHDVTYSTCDLHNRSASAAAPDSSCRFRSTGTSRRTTTPPSPPCGTPIAAACSTASFAGSRAPAMVRSISATCPMTK